MEYLISNELKERHSLRVKKNPKIGRQKPKTTDTVKASPITFPVDHRVNHSFVLRKALLAFTANIW